MRTIVPVQLPEREPELVGASVLEMRERSTDVQHQRATARPYLELVKMPPLVVDDAPDSEEAEEETTVLLALALALVVVELVLQSPGDIMPYRHLQDLEHRLP